MFNHIVSGQNYFDLWCSPEFTANNANNMRYSLRVCRWQYFKTITSIYYLYIDFFNSCEKTNPNYKFSGYTISDINNVINFSPVQQYLKAVSGGKYVIYYTNEIISL